MHGTIRVYRFVFLFHSLLPHLPFFNCTPDLAPVLTHPRLARRLSNLHQVPVDDTSSGLTYIQRFTVLLNEVTETITPAARPFDHIAAMLGRSGIGSGSAATGTYVVDGSRLG